MIGVEKPSQFPQGRWRLFSPELKHQNGEANEIREGEEELARKAGPLHGQPFRGRLTQAEKEGGQEDAERPPPAEDEGGNRQVSPALGNSFDKLGKLSDG